MSVLIILIFFVLAAVGLTFYFLKHDRGHKKPVGALWAAVGFGFAGAILAGIIEALTIPIHLTTGNIPSGPVLLISALGIGLIEESCKFIPLAAFLYHKKYFSEHADGVIFFAMAGLGFGVPENIMYSIQFGASTGIVRLITTPFFHAAVTALVGYYLIKIKMANQPVYKVWLPLAVAALLHGLYDFGLFYGSFNNQPLAIVMSLMITLGVTVGLFILFMRARELDEAAGLSAVGHNSFCRSCGYPNPEHNLYCTHCGKRA